MAENKYIKTKVETTETFIKDFPRSIEILNVVNDRYYFFDKCDDGTIARGMFTSFGNDEFFVSRFDFVFDRNTKETFEITKE